MQQEIKSKDGRSERTERSKNAIVEALLSLYVDGILVPTAQEVADRSGLGIRTVFRHFNEMESLFTAGDTFLYKNIVETSMPNLTDSLQVRCEQLVAVRAKNCARIRPYILAAHAQAWKYKVLRKNYRKLCAKFKQRMFDYIPELQNKPAAIVDSIEMLLSFESWNRLRHIQNLSQKETKAVMLTSLTAMIDAK